MSLLDKKGMTGGFTLLEVLVVLVITSLISVVLVQGFSLILSARNSVQNKIVGLEQVILKQNVFLEPLKGILPDYSDRPNVFGGEPQAVRGLTIRPLQSRIGTPVGFYMSMDYDAQRDETELVYEENGLPPQSLGRWAGSEGKFLYRDRIGKWLDTWPPNPDVTQTPWLIQLVMGSGFPSSLIVSLNGPHQRTLRFQDLPFGSTAINDTQINSGR